MTLPLVSVIIPCYNGAPYLGESIQSALAQTHGRMEVIVVDDGSSDSSAEVARRFTGPNVRLICSPNRGAAAARNIGLAAASGDFIQYLDADDFLSPDKVAAQVERLAGEPAGCLATSGIVFFDDGQRPQEGIDSDGTSHAGDSDSPLEFLLRLYGMDGPAGMVAVSQWLVPRSVSDAAGPWNEGLTVNDDGEYFARVVEHSTGVRHTPKGRAYYRKHPGGPSLSSGWRTSARHFKSCIDALDGIRETLVRMGADARGQRTLARFYCEWAVAAYPQFPEVARQAIRGARNCGVERPVLRLPTRKGRIVQALVGWRLARRIQCWLK